MPLSRLILQFVGRHPGPYAASAAMLVVIALLLAWMPRHIGRIVDGLAAGTLDRAGLAEALAWLLGAGLLVYLLRAAWRLLLYATAWRLGVQLRERLYAQLTRQGGRFFQSRRTGDLMALATNDIDAVEMAAGEALLAGFDGTLTLLVVLAAMAIGVDWRLALVALLPFPALALAFWWISRHLHTAQGDALTRFGDLNNQVQESLAGVRTLRALGLLAHTEAVFAQRAAAASAASLRAQRWEAAYEPAVGISFALSTVLVLGVGAALVWRGQISIGQLTSFGLYLGQLIWPMFAAGWVLALIERGRAAWARLAPVLEAPPDIADAGAVTEIPAGPIVARGLRLAYAPNDPPALDGVDFTLAPGQTLGLVGPTGCGKSTLLRLLLRQLEPDTGQICWGGVALPRLRLDVLRAACAWVPQEGFLFSATVAENIALARPQATRAAIEHAARLAAVHEDILRLPLGYDTPVGERGVQLSGGQRQRVALARALLADAPLLLLDDALSAVDTETETTILRHLRAARQGRSVVIACHRLSAVVDADHILVLHTGRVVEQGRHAALVAAGGWYTRQWRYQQLEASLDAD